MKMICTILLLFLIVEKSPAKVFFCKPKGFNTYASDNRILYETGAEKNAKIIADTLDVIIEQIQNKQYRPFTNKIKIYVFSNLANYERHCPSKGSGGHTFSSYIIISPKEANTPERLPRILAHELSHFHLVGYTGIVKDRRLPTWFKEGLAVWASGGAGAEKVSESEAAQSLLSGMEINRVYQNPILGSKNSHPKNMTTHMFYKQSGMFINYLRQSNTTNFQELLYRVQEKRNFKNALTSSYEKSLNQLWSDFLTSIR